MGSDTDYWNAFDKQRVSQEYTISPKRFGLGVVGDPLQMLKTNISVGASHLELGFSGGGGKSSSQQPSPEMIGRDKRQEIRQLAKINKVTTSTHTHLGTTGLSGFEQNKFSEEKAAVNVQEVKKAIDFAAEATNGGAVVMHTGEFFRPISTFKEFEQYESEAKKAPIGLINKESGEVIGFNKDIELPMLMKKVKDKDGKVIDLEPLKEDVYNVKEEKFKIESIKFEEFETYYKNKKKDAKDEEIAMKFYEEYLAHDREHADSESKRLIDIAMGSKNKKEKFEALDNDLREGMTSQEVINVAKKHGFKSPQEQAMVTELAKNPDGIKDQINQLNREVIYYQEGAISQARQLEQIKKKTSNLMSLEKYGVDKSTDNMAKLGMYAYEKTKVAKPDKPIFVAPENVFPEWGYGSHPDELRKLVIGAREKMAKELEKKGMKRQQADVIAQDHIKATFDIAHANIWRKYFKAEEGMSFEEQEKSFNKWLISQVKSLAKDKVLGHIHVSDNFGYADEHLTLGEGNVPLDSFAKALKEVGFKDQIIVEGGAQGEGKFHEALTGAWERMGSSMTYKFSRSPQTWSDVQASWAGTPYGTRNLVGPYATSINQNFKFREGVPPLE